MSKKGKTEHKIVNFTDVNELLSFTKREVRHLEEEIQEDKRIEKELKEFVDELESNTKKKIRFIGHEKKQGLHIVRFLFKDGGFMEIMLEKPLAINAHFLDQESAEEFAKGLKKYLKKTLPESPIKEMYIDSVKISDGSERGNVLTLSKWTKMHSLAINKTVVITVIAIIVFILIESVKLIFHDTTLELLEKHSFIMSWVVGIILGVIIEPLKAKIEHIVEKLMGILVD